MASQKSILQNLGGSHVAGTAKLNADSGRLRRKLAADHKTPSSKRVSFPQWWEEQHSNQTQGTVETWLHEHLTGDLKI